jgi:nucleoside-diphosphate-sugar epimerase
MSVKHALVTGSGGFVGRHLLPKLEAAGYKVQGLEKNLGADLLRYMDIFNGPSNKRFDVIVHLAANIESIDKRLQLNSVDAYFDIGLDLRVAKFVELNPPTEAFIAMSSCAVDNPKDPYAYVKLTLEKFCQRLHLQGIPVSILRPFSGYGADQALSYPFPAIVDRAMRREDPLTVWGSVNTVRDWIHIEDLTDAIMWAIKDAPRGVPIDIGTGIGTPFHVLATNIAHAAGYYPRIESRDDKPTSGTFRVAIPDLAQDHGFTTKISLMEGIKDAIAQYSAIESARTA